jgi:hypothetical protein
MGSPTSTGAEGDLPPSRKLVGFAGLWAAYTLFLGLLYTHLPANPDQQIFDYIGWIAHRGGRLYLDATEQNFPGKMWIHQLSTALFGNHVWSYRLFDYLLLLASVPFLVLPLRAELGTWRALLIVPFYQAMYVTAGSWMAGQRDIVAAPMLLAAALAYRVRARGAGRGWLWLFALGVVYAMLIRPTYLLFAPMLVLADALTARARGRSVRSVLADGAVAAGCCVGLLAVVVVGAWRSGTLAAWYEGSIQFNVEIYARSQTYRQITLQFLELIKSWHWYLAFGALGAGLWWRRGRDRFLFAIVVALAATAVLSAYVQRKGFGYHLAGLMPVLALFDVYFVWWCVGRALERRQLQATALAGVVCAVAVLGLGKKVLGDLGPQLRWLVGGSSWHAMLVGHGGQTTYADIFDAAEYIRRTVAPEKEVLAWSRYVHVNFLAERRSPVRFITVGMMTSARAPFRSAPAWTAELAAAFASHPPEIIVLPERTRADEEGLWTDANPSGPSRVFWQQLQTRYRHEIGFGGLDLFRLQAGSSSQIDGAPAFRSITFASRTSEVWRAWR